MLPKAHLTSHSRVSGSRWVITPSWLSESLISFLYNSSVYYCHLFLISSASVKSIPFLSFIVPIFAWNVPLVSLIFYKGSLVFAILLFSSIFFCIVHSERLSYLSLLFGTVHSDGISFLFSFTFLFSFLLSYLWGLLRPPCCLFAFPFLGDGFDHCLLYSVTNICP